MPRRLTCLAFGILALCSPAVAAQSQDVILTGRVTTSEDGLSLPGATVSIPSLNLSTKTDQDGRYELTIPAARAREAGMVEVRVTFTGLPTRSVRIKLTPGTTTQDSLSVSRSPRK